MGNKWDEVRAAYYEAKNQLDAADSICNDMAEMLCGRLLKVSSYELKKLKRELRDFNIHTGVWK
jgi:hypothetical protein